MLLSEASALLLRAVALTGPEAVGAFHRWRAMTDINHPDFRSHRILPLLVDLVQREGLSDIDLNRMRGVSRHIWTQNTLHMRLLLGTLDALASEDIHPLLLKGVALFARSPQLMARRASGDADIMVSVDELERTVRVLRHAGFEPTTHHWDDFGPALVDSITSGAGIEKPGQMGHIDLHWRPLWNVHDPELAEGILARAEQHRLEGRLVLLPSPTDQLFMALARCEPWDDAESFTRLLEALFLLRAHAAQVDWQELHARIRHYGFETIACAFFGELKHHTTLEIPETLLAQLDADLPDDQRREWDIRAIPPEERSDRQRWMLQGMDVRSRRHEGLSLPNEDEMRLREIGLDPTTAMPLWQALRARTPASPPVQDIRFIEGFSYPERDGRWSLGRWSAIAVPLSDAQQAGAPLHLNAYAFFGHSDQVRIVLHGGKELLDRTLLHSEGDTDLGLVVQPVPELGGAGLVLIWIPDAHTPSSAGLSYDRRELGLFIRRLWQSIPQPASLAPPVTPVVVEERPEEPAPPPDEPRAPPTALETWLRRFEPNRRTGALLWQSLRKRVALSFIDDIQFIEGFSDPETEGRWSMGHWCAFAVPLTASEQAGEPLRINAYAFTGNTDSVRIAVHGGVDLLTLLQRPDESTELALTVLPISELGGAGLLLIWTPDAHSPASAGLSDDERELGLFVRQDWRL